jgi:hypothetical protein
MARQRKAPGVDPFADLAKKVEILEREMSIQRAALDRLKAMATSRHTLRQENPTTARKTA